MIYDISELDQLGHEMKVKLNKAINYTNSFALDYFKAKALIESGKYGPYWTFDFWVSSKVGRWPSSILKVLRAHEQWMASEEKEKLAEATKQSKQTEKERKQTEADQKRAQREAEAELRRAEREAEAERKREEKEAMEREKAVKKAAEEADKDRETKLKERETRKEKEAALFNKAFELRQGKDDDDATPIMEKLDEYNNIERSHRVKIGELFMFMREEINMKRAGLNPGGKHWVWSNWCEVHIERTLRDIQYCIDAYYQSIAVAAK